MFHEQLPVPPVDSTENYQTKPLTYSNEPNEIIKTFVSRYMLFLITRVF